MKNKLEMGFALLVIVSVGVMMVWQQYPEQARDGYKLAEFRLAVSGFLVIIFAVIYFAWSSWRTVKALDESIRQRSEQAHALQRERDFASSLINTVPVSILLLDAQGVINYINPCFEQLTGYQLEDIRGKDWFSSFLPERDRERIRASFLSVTSDKPIRSNVSPIVIRNGEEREIEWNSQAIHDAHGKIAGVISIGRDVTEQRLREQEIQRLASIVRYSSDFIGIFSLNGGVQFLNTAGRQLVGINDDEYMFSARLAGYFAEADRHFRVPEILSAVEATGRWVDEANFCHFQTGASIAVMLDVFRIDDPITGQPINFGMVASDLRTQKANEERLRLNELRLNEAQRIAKVGSWELDLQSGELIWTDETFDLFEIDKTKFNATYQGFLDTVHPDDRELVDQVYTNSLRQHIDYEIIHRLSMPDGRIKWVEELGTSDFDAGGKPVRSRGTVQDITRSHLEAQATLAVRAELQAVLDAATEVSIVSTDEHGLICLFNKGAEAMLGYRAEEVVNKQTPAFFHLPAEIAARCEELSREYGQPVEGMAVFFEPARRGDLRPHEWTYVRKDGSQLKVSKIVTAKHNGDGKIIGFLGVATDITERKHAETALKKMNEELEQRVELRTAELVRAKDEAVRANNAKSEFLSRMSHELRTPMNAIMGFGQLLETDTEHPLVPDQLDNVQEILKASKHLLELINEVLDLARIESGRVDLAMEAIDILSLIKECVALFQPSIAARQIELMLEMDGNYIITADRLRLRQIVLNLLANAIKYNREAGSIQVSSRLSGENRVRIAFCDTGIGIPAESLPNLFKPFERLESAYNGIEGCGIGLALCKQLIEAMGGAIGVESTMDEGSTFWVDCIRSERPAVGDEERKLPI